VESTIFLLLKLLFHKFRLLLKEVIRNESWLEGILQLFPTLVLMLSYQQGLLVNQYGFHQLWQFQCNEVKEYLHCIH